MDLSVELCGVKFANPVWVSSQISVSHVNPRQQADLMRHYADQGASAIITPAILDVSKPYKPEPARRIIAARARRPFRNQGLIGLGLSDRNLTHLEFGLELMEHLRGSDVPIIANILGASANTASWVGLAQEVERLGASLIELDTSCPLSAAEDLQSLDGLPLAAGYLLGQVPRLLQSVVRAVVEGVNIPVSVKMTPEIGYPQFIEVARTIAEAGANAITAINAPITIAPPNIYNLDATPFPLVQRYTFGPTFGPWDRFLTYKYVAGIAQNVDTQISAVGGLVDPEHAVEALMLGATTVQLSSGILWRGTYLIQQVLRFLHDYLEEHGFNSTQELIGLGLHHIGALEAKHFVPAIALVNESKCTGCTLCAMTTCVAITMRSGLAVVDESVCSGCNLCVEICPPRAISLIPVDGQ
jgi:dihydropyrimidine dehydrogenase (NAD+) subunit PreA